MPHPVNPVYAPEKICAMEAAWNAVIASFTTEPKPNNMIFEDCMKRYRRAQNIPFTRKWF